MESGHMVMEAGKPWDRGVDRPGKQPLLLLPTGWWAPDPEGADAAASDWRQERGRCLSSKTVRQENSFIWGQVSLLFYSSFYWLYEGAPLLGRIICFTESTKSNADLTPNTLIDTPRGMFDQMHGHPTEQSSWLEITLHMDFPDFGQLAQLPERPWHVCSECPLSGRDEIAYDFICVSGLQAWQLAGSQATPLLTFTPMLLGPPPLGCFLETPLASDHPYPSSSLIFPLNGHIVLSSAFRSLSVSFSRDRDRILQPTDSGVLRCRKQLPNIDFLGWLINLAVSLGLQFPVISTYYLFLMDFRGK